MRRAIEAFDLLLSVAIPKNFNDDHYFMFPGTVWRAFETGRARQGVLRS